MEKEEVKKPVALRMKDSTHTALRIHCIQRKIKVQDFVDKAIVAALKRESK